MNLGINILRKCAKELTNSKYKHNCKRYSNFDHRTPNQDSVSVVGKSLWRTSVKAELHDMHISWKFWLWWHNHNLSQWWWKWQWRSKLDEIGYCCLIALPNLCQGSSLYWLTHQEGILCLIEMFIYQQLEIQILISWGMESFLKMQNSKIYF